MPSICLNSDSGWCHYFKTLKKRKLRHSWHLNQCIREVYLDLYLMLLDEYLCVPTGTTRDQLASLYNSIITINTPPSISTRVSRALWDRDFAEQTFSTRSYNNSGYCQNRTRVGYFQTRDANYVNLTHSVETHPWSLLKKSWTTWPTTTS